jgi:hypothetical protein
VGKLLCFCFFLLAVPDPISIRSEELDPDGAALISAPSRCTETEIKTDFK